MGGMEEGRIPPEEGRKEGGEGGTNTHMTHTHNVKTPRLEERKKTVTLLLGRFPRARGDRQEDCGR